MNKPDWHNIKLVILDVDGTLTDGRIAYLPDGSDIKFFNIKDGMGIKLLQEAKIIVAIISAKKSNTAVYRFADLKIKDVYLGAGTKISVYEKLKEKYGLTDREICCVGDDIADIPLFKKCGIGIAVSDAAKEAIKYADVVTRLPGGMGAVREAAELILKNKGIWDNLITEQINLNE